MMKDQEMRGLYSPAFEHDNCGIGAVVNKDGKKSHLTVERALHIVENLEHRAGKDAEGKTGDGVGIMLQISHKFFSKVCKKEGILIGGEREYGVAQCSRSLWRKKEWNSWAGVRCRSSRTSSDRRQGPACPASSRHL